MPRETPSSRLGTTNSPIGDVREAIDSVTKDLISERCEEVATILDPLPLAPTIYPAAFMQMYRFLKKNQHYSAKDIEAQHLRLLMLDKKEGEFKKSDIPLPTIGIELEYPTKPTQHSEQEKLFLFARIPAQISSTSYWEVSPNYSYSPAVMECILDELKNLSIVPTKTNSTSHQDERFTRDVVGNGRLSLHINLGIPDILSADKLNRNGEVSLLSSMLAFAYASPDRLESRKTTTSFRTSRDANISEKIRAKAGKSLKRLEIRATEFRDNSTYRLLSDAQLLAGCLFASQLSNNNSLEEAWESFKVQAQTFEKKHGLYRGKIDKDKDSVANQMRRNPSIQQDAVRLVASFSEEAAAIIWTGESLQRNAGIIFDAGYQI